MNSGRAVRKAEELFQKGRLKEAESVCGEILKERPDSEEALHLLGIVHYELGEYDLAISFIKKVLRLNRKNADAWYDMGNIYLKTGELDEAISNYQKAVEVNPAYSDAYNNLGNALHDKGRLDEAISCYRKALEISPEAAYINNNIGLLFQDKGQIDDAMEYYQKAVRIEPGYADALYNLGNAFQHKGRPDKAIPYYRKAIETDGNFAEAHYNLGCVLKEQGLLDEALSSYNRALALNMDSADLYLSIGYILQYQGRKDEALDSFGKALERDPGLFSARYAQCMARLPVIYTDPESIRSARREYRDELLRLREMLSEKSFDLNSAAAAIGGLQPFLLAYQGINDRELQQIYGDMVCKIMSLRYPEYSERPPMPVLLSDEKIRVGIVSGYFYRHSNWKIPIRGWAENLDRRRFALYGYNTGKVKDMETEAARQCFDRFVEDISFEDLCESVIKDRLHLLIYPEIGMNGLTVRLASLRLAPVQCASWGHPETSGLPTIDYFLSSDLMEPPEAEDHYTEKLVRLPNLSVFYTPPRVTLAKMDRSDLGLPEKHILYLCCQSLLKYLPQYDEVYPMIAGQVRDCKFLFISDVSSPVTKQFRIRLNKAFERFRLNADEYVVFLSYLSPEKYQALNRIVDVYLDSIDWSGCNSTLEALSHNLPVVTLPGKLMRGRHGSAILGMMGIEDTIVSTLDDYVSLAVRLGLEREQRVAAAENVRNRKHRAYGDMTCIVALENFIEEVVKGPGA